MKELGAMYRALGPEARNYYKEVGELAKRAAKHGQPAFGPRRAAIAAVAPRGQTDRALGDASDSGHIAIHL